MRHAALCIAIFAVFLDVFACSKAHLPASAGENSAAGPVDFAFEIAGERRFLAELRSRPLLLVFIRTSEITSQLYMRELVAAYGQIAGEMRFLVLTIEPTEAPFVEMYAEFEELPFLVGVAEPAVVQGKSQLEVVPAIPATYFLDASGSVVHTAVGVVRADDLIGLYKRLFE